MKTINFKDLKVDIKILYTHFFFGAAENRNVGWKFARGEYVCFLDADDYYVENRFEILAYFIRKLNPDMLLHDYVFDYEKVSLNFNTFALANCNYIDSTSLKKNTFFNRKTFGKNPGDTNIILPEEYATRHKIHHAHITIKRNLNNFFKFPPLYSHNDGKLCLDVLSQSNLVFYLPLQLSIYNTKESTFKEKNIFQSLKIIYNRLLLKIYLLLNNEF